MITNHDRWVFKNLDIFDGNEDSTDLDVNVFFDLMEELVENHFDAKEGVKHGHHTATCVPAC